MFGVKCLGLMVQGLGFSSSGVGFDRSEEASRAAGRAALSMSLHAP